MLLAAQCGTITKKRIQVHRGDFDVNLGLPGTRDPGALRGLKANSVFVTSRRLKALFPFVKAIPVV